MAITRPTINRGVERRKKQRRSGLSRRELVRWEPDKADRRQGKGRRALDGAWFDKPRG